MHFGDITILLSLRDLNHNMFKMSIVIRKINKLMFNKF